MVKCVGLKFVTGIIKLFILRNVIETVTTNKKFSKLPINRGWINYGLSAAA